MDKITFMFYEPDLFVFTAFSGIALQKKSNDSVAYVGHNLRANEFDRPVGFMLKYLIKFCCEKNDSKETPSYSSNYDTMITPLMQKN